MVERPVQTLALESIIADKGQHRHFMAKEIHEQPTVIARAFAGWMMSDRSRVTSPAQAIDWANVSRLTIVACGTAFLAGHVAKVWLEKIARLPVELEIASEFRYREPPLPRHGVVMVISQSGETADTLAALRYAKAQGNKTLGLVNVTSSTIAREADVMLATHAGPEIGVASTKAFTAQMMCLAALAAMVARERGELDEAGEREAIAILSSVPRVVAETIALEPAFARLAADISDATSALFLGRGMMYPIALEGALKLKEITYIHAEGYAAGELKHGPIALVDEATPIIALASSGDQLEKTVSNLREVVARKGRVALIGDRRACEAFREHAWRSVAMPETDPMVAPFAYAVAVQFLAYHAALQRGTDVDQPRNLAKSVTVE
jgi:glucosamine--fructose-6-phosphate aminotransferase (isomerizing)